MNIQSMQVEHKAIKHTSLQRSMSKLNEEYQHIFQQVALLFNKQITF